MHFALQDFDDGRLSTTNLVDITNANSRIGFYIEPVDGGDGLSFQFETGAGFRPSSNTSQIYVPEFFDWSRRDLRQVQLIYKGGFGTFRAGQGSMPLDGAAESDLGGTVVAAKSTIQEANGSYLLRDATGVLSTIEIGDAFNNFDGARRMRLRYDSPSVLGVSLAVGYGQEVLKSGDDKDYYDFAFRYRQDFSSVKVAAALGSGYARDAAGVVRTTVGSVSLLHPGTGLNISVASGLNAASGADYVYAKLGWNAQVLPAGDTKLSLEAYRGNDYVSARAGATMWGISLIQNIDAAGVEAYLGYRAFDYSDPGPSSYQDAGAVQLGARWRF